MSNYKVKLTRHDLKNQISVLRLTQAFNFFKLRKKWNNIIKRIKQSVLFIWNMKAIWLESLFNEHHSDKKGKEFWVLCQCSIYFKLLTCVFWIISLTRNISSNNVKRLGALEAIQIHTLLKINFISLHKWIFVGIEMTFWVLQEVSYDIEFSNYRSRV